MADSTPASGSASRGLGQFRPGSLEVPRGSEANNPLPRSKADENPISQGLGCQSTKTQLQMGAMTVLLQCPPHPRALGQRALGTSRLPWRGPGSWQREGRAGASTPLPVDKSLSKVARSSSACIPSMTELSGEEPLPGNTLEGSQPRHMRPSTHGWSPVWSVHPALPDAVS